MNIKRILREYGLAIVLALETAISGYLAFFPDIIKNTFFRYFVPSIFLIGFIIEIMNTVIEKRKGVDISSESREKIKEDSKQVFSDELNVFSQEIKEEIGKSNGDKLQRYESTELLTNLVKYNFIPINEVEKILPNEKFIVVFCYPFGGPNIPDDIKKDNRLYQGLLYDLSFVRIGANFFIIPERNLFPEKLRDIDKLTDYVKKGIILYSNKEWKNLLIKIKNSKHKLLYENWKDKDNPLKFDFLIYKVDMAELKHIYIRGTSLTNEFLKELISVSNIRKIRLKEEDKANIKDFILKSSLNILIIDLPSVDKTKILVLEKRFKEELKINNFYDYANENRDRILEILKSKFENKLANEYTDKLISRSKKYKEELRSLGII